MSRRKKYFSEEVNFRISQLIEINKTLEEIRQDIFKNFNFSVSKQTLSNQIKSLGYEDYDCRETSNIKSHKLTYEQKIYIQFQYETGASLSEISKSLKQEYDIDITEPTINKIIKKEGFIRGEKKEFDWDEEDDWDDIQNEEVNIKDIKEVEVTIQDNQIYQETLETLKNDPKIDRYNSYMSDSLYNYEGDGERAGMKDTWYTRDGFLKIIINGNIFYLSSGVEYTIGEYRTETLFEHDLNFYTFKNQKDFMNNALIKNDKLFKKRKEIKKWYNRHRPRINELYDIIVEKNYSSTIPEIKEFNELCKEMYNLKMEYRDLYYSLNKYTRNLLKYESGNKQTLGINDFSRYMTGGLGKDWGKIKINNRRFG